MIEVDTAPSRAERRRRSEATILDAARHLFAEVGYERATIRAVAQRAGIDPALVMQNFGSKDGLFAAAVRWSVPTEGLTGADRGELPRMALEHALDAFDNPNLRPAAEALLRSCLTHPAAEAVMRDEVMRQAQAQVAATIGGADAALRAALLNAVTLGLTISRYLLADPAVADAEPADLQRLLGPALQALVCSVPDSIDTELDCQGG
ncbi:TetR/AcrR family transcriptional regulator [Pseudonocardia sp. KRD291]|uniref:TetR/AcrR family transcriptional regulator n=1 Tax=Pseudonocardia sp. KRD291 TaxID=2792007 RepID=UPI001C49CFFC|nr:TetR/AcrR family transcriptional regulator [Pseudonocardia sp. KRD291]